MKKEEFMSHVEDRFNKSIEEFDSSPREYYLKKYDCHKNISDYNQVLRKYFQIDDLNDTNKDKLSLRNDFSGEYAGRKFERIIISLGNYKRKENGVKKRFSYYEIFQGDSIFSLLCKADDLSDILIDEFSISSKQAKTLLNLCDYSKSIFEQTTTENEYEYDWLENYNPSENEITRGEISIIKDFRNQNLFFSILGYAILAFLKGYKKNNKLDFCPINIITDTASENSVRMLIAHCLVRSGNKDLNNLNVINLNKITKSTFEDNKGRLVIINTTKCKTDDIENRIRSLMPNLYPYLEQGARKIRYEYKSLPIFISKVDLGSKFINIDATELNSMNWNCMCDLIHKLYDYPIYTEFMLRQGEESRDPVEGLFRLEKDKKKLMIYDRFMSFYESGKNDFTDLYRPQDITLPKNYYEMQLLLWSCCCLTLPESNQYCYDETQKELMSTYKSLIDMVFIPNNCLKGDSEVKFDFVPNPPKSDQIDSSGKDNFTKLLKYIFDNASDSEPCNRNEAGKMAFKRKYKECDVICFREEFFNKVINELSLHGYKWNEFKSDCKNNELVENGDYNVRVDGQQTKFFSLNTEELKNYLTHSFSHSQLNESL